MSNPQADAPRINHDRLFKELISTFFIEFLELFFPQILNYLDRNSVIFREQEIFTDVTSGEEGEIDIIAQVKFQKQDSFFLVHIEPQSSPDTKFNKRMFRYFARLHEKFDLPIYPIVVFSYDKPKKLAENKYQVEFPDLQVLKFNYRVIQLNSLNWRDYLNQPNPVASALMAKMKIAPEDRPKVKAECLRLLVTLKLDRARMKMISGFVDTYLRLTKAEEEQFRAEIGNIELKKREKVMQIVTSWMEEGIEQGRQEGIQEEIQEEIHEGLISAVMRLLKRKLGQLDSSIETKILSLKITQLEELTEALLDFSTVDNLTDWLTNLD